MSCWPVRESPTLCFQIKREAEFDFHSSGIAIKLIFLLTVKFAAERDICDLFWFMKLLNNK
jgi:hypothetical protein